MSNGHDPRRVTGIVIFSLLIAVGVAFVYWRFHAQRASVAEILRDPDRFDGTFVQLDGRVTAGAPKFDDMLIGYYGSFELDDGTGKIGLRFDEGKVAAPAVSAHVVVKARAQRPEQVSVGPGAVPPAGKTTLALVAESIETP
jgi:hypothetical protein